MKKLNITKERFNTSKYFQTKYGKLEYVSESGKVYKTSKGRILKFNESDKKVSPIKEVFLSQAPKLLELINKEFKQHGYNIEWSMSSNPSVMFSDGYFIRLKSSGDWNQSARFFNYHLGNMNPPLEYKDLVFKVGSWSAIYLKSSWRPEGSRGTANLSFDEI